MSHSPSIEELLIRDDRTIRDALAVIDRNAQGICFAVDGAGRLVGVLTDGDIRRALIAGRQVALVDDVMTTGMTAAAATQALLAAGAAAVQVWVLARTPAPQN